MKKFSLALAVILVLVALSIIPAMAGQGPSWYVAVSSGNFASWGQEIVSGAVYLADPEVQEYDRSFAAPEQTASWTAIVRNGNLCDQVVMNSAPDVVNGKIWSGPKETRAYYQTTFSLAGAIWGNRELTVRNSSGFPVILNIPVSTGFNQTYWFSSSETYTYSLTKASMTPEPSSLLALGIGLVGPIGFAIRRKR